MCLCLALDYFYDNANFFNTDWMTLTTSRVSARKKVTHALRAPHYSLSHC